MVCVCMYGFLCYRLVFVFGLFFFFFQAEDGIRDIGVTGVQTCALPICLFVCLFACFIFKCKFNVGNLYILSLKKF